MFSDGTEALRREEGYMKTRALSWLVLFSLFLATLMVVPNRALADDDDPPSRVARLSYTNGQVSFSPSGTDDWVSAVLNRPITTGDKLWTDQNSRAELQIGSAAIRLGDQTGFSFLNLDDRVMQIRLTEGTIGLRVRRMAQDETIEIDTPNLAFNVLRPGRYRINVNEAGDTTVINVREGEGEVTGGGSAFTLHPDQQGYFTGTDALSPDIESLAPEDGFDAWCNERDLREDHAAARRYVSDDVIGYEDLDEYGGWRPVPDYGTVWFPHVSVVGWAPYRFGHWAWISPWGWTWVDDAPWGFAPFHYGRWVFAGGGWGWVPCPPRVVAVAYVRPVYAPALVAWVGGPHFAAGVAFGGGGGFAAGVNVGWFPLGPREVFVPSYPVSRTYVNNVNISNTTVNQTVINNYYNTTIVNKNVNVNNVRYVNQNVPGAVTATSGHAFTSAQAVNRNIVAVNQREINGAPIAVRAPAVVPPRQAVLGSGAATNVRPPAALQGRGVVAKTTPPPAPLAFSARQAAIEKNEGRPISLNEARQLQAAQPNHVATSNIRMAPPARTINPPVTNNRVNNAQPGPLNNNRPTNTNVPSNPQNRPENANVPANPQNHPENVNANQPPANSRNYNDRPPASRNNTYSNPQLEQKHQQQIEQLQQKQDQQYQKLQQKQVQEQQRSQPNANDQHQQQLEQKHEQQMQQLQQKQRQQQETLQQKQQNEHQKAYKEPPSNNKSTQSHDDKPPQHH